MKIVRVHGINRAQRRVKARLWVLHDVQQETGMSFRKAYEYCKERNWLGDYLAQ